MENPGAWRSKPFPDDVHVLMDELLPDESGKQFGEEWPTLRKHCSLIIAVLAADLRSRGPDCPFPRTYGGICRMLSNSPKYLTEFFTAIANTRRTPPIPAINDNARAILSLPRKERDLFFTMIAGFVREYERRNDSAQR